MSTAKQAKAAVEPMRQRSQFTCMASSMTMCLKALGYDNLDEDQVNRVMGAQPMKGAAWEQALACAQHYGCRATLTMPATVEQLKAWTDAGVPVMIAWNPEGRPWSHASVVFDVDADLNVYVADPNIPNPKETVRIVSEADFYGKWYEKFPDYLVRRPACAIEREITLDGKQVRLASTTAATHLWTDPHKSPKGVHYPKSKWDHLAKHAPFRWATPAAGVGGGFPEPWRVSDKDAALVLLKKLVPQYHDLYTDYDSTLHQGHLLIWVGLRDNRDKPVHQTRIGEIVQALKKAHLPFLPDKHGSHLWLMDDIKKDVLSHGKKATSGSGTPPPGTHMDSLSWLDMWVGKPGWRLVDTFTSTTVGWAADGFDPDKTGRSSRKGQAFYHKGDPVDWLPKATQSLRGANTAGFMDLFRKKPVPVAPKPPQFKWLSEAMAKVNQPFIDLLVEKFEKWVRPSGKGFEFQDFTFQPFHESFIVTFVKHEPALKSKLEKLVRSFGVQPVAARFASPEDAIVAREVEAKGPKTPAKTQDEKRREDRTITIEKGTPRNEVMRDLIQRGQSGQGKHKNKQDFDRGRARNPKHKKDFDREAADRVAERFIQAAYSGNPDGKPIYPVEIDHGAEHALSGGHDVMKRLQDQYRIEQGHEPRENQETRLASTGLDCQFWRATDGKWYMALEDWSRRGQYNDYGPFGSFGAAEKFLEDNFTNPGAWSKDNSGRKPPPRNPQKSNQWDGTVYEKGATRLGSTGLDCRFWLATDGKWYMALESYNHRHEYDNYGPFSSFDQADKFLSDNFANPGGFSEDDSGKRPPPREPINPREHSRWAAKQDPKMAAKDRFIDMDGNPFDVGSRIEWWPVASAKSWSAPVIGIDGKNALVGGHQGKDPVLITPVEMSKHVKVVKKGSARWNANSPGEVERIERLARRVMAAKVGGTR